VEHHKRRQNESITFTFDRACVHDLLSHKEDLKDSPMHEANTCRFIQEVEDEHDTTEAVAEKRRLHCWDDLRNSGISFESEAGFFLPGLS